jgi:ABC-type dipeptide/oligopeptide/nickel transport system permease subunit
MSLLAEGLASLLPADGSGRATWRVCPSYAVDQLRNECLLDDPPQTSVTSYGTAVDGASSIPAPTLLACSNSKPSRSTLLEDTMSSTDAASRSTTPAKAAATMKRGTRELGDPYFHQLVVGGTLSLGVLLIVGALAILAIMLMEQSNFRDADLDGFTSLGEACLVESSFD